MLYINAFGGNDVLVTSDKVFGKGQLRIMQVDMVDPVSKKMVSTQKEYYIKIKDKKSIALNLDNINGAVWSKYKKPWINILCKSENTVEEAITPQKVQTMFGNSYPYLEHYWKTTTYGHIDISGTQTI